MGQGAALYIGNVPAEPSSALATMPADNLFGTTTVGGSGEVFNQNGSDV
jgi:hypothetical protein